MRLRVACAALAALGLAFAGPARADAIADFYKGKTVSMIVGYAPGGINDISARLVGRYIVKHIPGEPNLVVNNMPAASGIAAINHMYNVAQKDGSVISIIGRAIPQLAYMNDPNIRFDPNKFVWLGSISSYADDAYPIFIMADRPIKSWEELKLPGKKIVLGAVGPGSTNLTFALIAKDTLHLNIDVIRGYTGAAPLFLAMQRGEIDGQVVGLGSLKAGQKTLWEQHKFRGLIQFGRTTRHRDLPDAPTGRELAAGDPDALALIAFSEAPFYMALPFIAPPNVPADRARALQDAFMATMKDPGFVAEAQKLDLDVSPIDGAAVAKLVHDMASTPPAIIEAFKTVSGLR
ncbi:MAG TPA: tripartite tricarboxylate transporter substrate-binding protein [Alphaproteobacteria bacterium]|nr:tripartite tricarboxylate transporter substrate-binding protein [Alphaproteobacteria bacterium]